MIQKHVMAFVAIAGVLPIGSPAADGGITQGLQACKAETDDARRLACYDREIQRIDKQPAAIAASPQAAPADPQQQFGYRGQLAREEQERQQTPKPGRLTAKVAEISTRPRGELVLTLDNGQVWEQKPAEPTIRLKVGDEVTIRAGTLGSFHLSTPSGRATRVTRVR